MTAPSPAYISVSRVSLVLARSPGGLVKGGVDTLLEGTSAYRQTYTADRLCPEELAAFYDDVDHEARSWIGLWRCVLEDVCTLQPKLF